MASLREEIDAIVILDVEPPLPSTRNPYILVRCGDQAAVTQQRRLHDKVAVGRRVRFAEQQALGIGGTLAQCSQLLRFIDMLIGIKSPDEALTIGIKFPLPDVDLYGSIRHGLTVHIDHGDLRGDDVSRCHPRLGFNAHEPLRRPEWHAGRHCLNLTVGVAIVQLQDQVYWLFERWQLRDARSGHPGCIQYQVEPLMHAAASRDLRRGRGFVTIFVASRSGASASTYHSLFEAYTGEA